LTQSPTFPPTSQRLGQLSLPNSKPSSRDRHKGPSPFSPFFLFFLYLSLAHIELLLLHSVVAHPELHAKAQKRRQGIMVNDTKLIIAVMHYRVYIYNILKFLFSYSEPYNLYFLKLLSRIIRHLFLLIAFSIDRGVFKVSGHCC
jgi:hypothetical protein